MCLLATGKPAERWRWWNRLRVAGRRPAVRAFLFCIAAHAAILQQRPDSALQLLLRAEEYARRGQDLEEQMHAWLVRGKLDLDAGQAAQALASLTQAHSLLSWTRNPFHQQQILRGPRSTPGWGNGRPPMVSAAIPGRVRGQQQSARASR
jgi:hypothetical protein